MKSSQKIFGWILNFGLVFLSLWIVLIYYTGGFYLNLGLFRIRATSFTNPIIFLIILIILKLCWPFKWLRPLLKEEPLQLDTRIIPDSLATTSLVLIGYVALTFFFTYPLIFHLTTDVPGDGGDNPMFLWNLWWVKKSLLDLKTNPFYSNYILYPLGAGLSAHTFTFMNGLLSIPFQLLFGLTVANNIIIILTFVLSAFGAYLLINYIIKDKVSSFLGGIIFAFCPYKFAHLLGHYNLVSTQWLPFYILYFLRLVKEDRARPRHGFLAGLFLLFTALTDSYYFVFLIIFSFLYLIYVFGQDRKIIINNSFFKGLIVLFATFFIGFSPFLISMISDIKAGGYSNVPGPKGATEYVADLLGFITPSVFHPLLKDFARQISKNFTGNACEWTVFTGYAGLILALITTIKYRKNREVRFWLISLTTFFVLSLGLYPHIAGKEIKIPMPFFIINIIPVLNNLRAPSRFNIMMMLSLAILAALAIRFILLNIRKPWPKFGAALFITVLISFEYLAIPFPMFKVMPPPIYHAIGQEKEKGTILDIPLGWQDGFKQIGSEKNQAQLMYLQIFHQKRIFGAYLARIPDAKIEYFCSLPIFSSIIKLQEIGYQPEVIDLVKERNLAEDFINKYDLSYIVIHRPYLDSLVHEYILEVFSLEKYYEDRKLIIYKIKEGETSVKRELPELFSESVNLSSLQTVVAEGSPFHARGNIRFRKTEIIQIGGLEPKSFSRLDISLDSNDIYEIAFKRGGRELRKFWIGPKELPERAMARYVIEIHPPVELADSMTIRGLHGDKYYFLGHILLE